MKIFLKVRFPMALPFFFSGLKIAITLSVTGAVVAEFVASDKGLGYTILAATSYWRAGLAFGAMILLGLLAILLFGLVWLAERILCPWYADKER
jgi:NitT/TauT family transport system permease protein